MRISGLIATAAALAAGSTTAIGDLQAPKAVLTLRKIVDGSDANLPCWRVSPDGRQLAFVDGDHATLGIRQVATGAVRIVERAGTDESIGRCACGRRMVGSSFTFVIPRPSNFGSSPSMADHPALYVSSRVTTSSRSWRGRRRASR